jgi:formate dehydrogenase maturation protein FdhE
MLHVPVHKLKHPSRRMGSEVTYTAKSRGCRFFYFIVGKHEFVRVRFKCLRCGKVIEVFNHT